MKKQIMISSAICLMMLLSACGQSTSQEQPPENAAEPAQEQSVQEESEAEALYKKYEGIINLLESEDYDGAKSSIDTMENEALAQKYGNIEDYLVTVDLTSDNFNEYFELYTYPKKNAFGEPTGRTGIRLRSKKYNEGLILYDPFDQQFNDDIIVEYTYTTTYSDETFKSELLQFERIIVCFV